MKASSNDCTWIIWKRQSCICFILRRAQNIKNMRRGRFVGSIAVTILSEHLAGGASLVVLSSRPKAFPSIPWIEKSNSAVRTHERWEGFSCPEGRNVSRATSWAKPTHGVVKNAASLKAGHRNFRKTSQCHENAASYWLWRPSWSVHCHALNITAVGLSRFSPMQWWAQQVTVVCVDRIPLHYIVYIVIINSQLEHWSSNCITETWAGCRGGIFCRVVAIIWHEAK